MQHAAHIARERTGTPCAGHIRSLWEQQRWIGGRRDQLRLRSERPRRHKAPRQHKADL
jgi:hypothetical protein